MKPKHIIYIVVFIAGYIFVSLITYKTGNKRGMTGKERIELTETFTHFFN